jgi:GNAT superfamily N-acetyltransferase
MARLEIRPFSDEFLAPAGALLAARHRAHTKAEPLLPGQYEDSAVAAAEVELLAHADGASGAVALRGEEAEDLRDLYGAAAARWADEELVRHYALVPASDPALVEAWSRVGFGQQHAHGIREVPESSWPEGVRLAEERDLDALVELAPLLPDHQSASPVFGGGLPQETDEELRAELLEDLGKDEIGDLVAEYGGRIVGALQIVPIELSSSHSGLGRPDGAALLSWAATFPDVRGSGAGLALTEAAFAWARGRGHQTIVADWRVTNLLASRFWPARGFRPTFLRLYRHIP